MRRIVLCAALFVGCVSCTGTGGAAEERARAAAAFDQSPAVMRDAVGTIRITNNCSGFVSRFVVGYHHRGGPLCIREGRVTRAVVWHESAHAHFRELPREAQAQWEGFVDKRLFHGEGVNIAIPGLYPYRGIITSYGGTDAGENYAEWITWLMYYLRANEPGYGRVDLATVDKSDSVYLAIITFFRDHSVLTEEEFGRVRLLFTE